uniref:GH18 domain-containing protein n=1 Tax=Peromyscus maniculatus bairdii TaxID=230844 RepID=A0A8C8T2J4_PERMB
MAKLILATGLAIVLNAQLNSAYKLMCYSHISTKVMPVLGSFNFGFIDSCLCTHIIFNFGWMPNNEIIMKNEDDLKEYKGIYDLKTRNKELKILLAIGGSELQSNQFSAIVSTAQSHQNFITSVISFLRQNNFDGLNLDWRYPGSGGNPPKDKHLFTLLVKEMREAFEKESLEKHKTRLLITATVSGIISIIEHEYKIPELSQSLDYIQVMTYDLHSSKDGYTGENSPLYEGPSDHGISAYLNVDYIMTYWKNHRADPKKLIVGFPTYGQTFTLSDPSDNGIGAYTISAGQTKKHTYEKGLWAYYEICNFLNQGATEKWNAPQEVPYAFRNTEWVGYDNVKSFQIKAQWLKDNNLGGAVVWPLNMNDFTGSFCNQGSFPLTSTLKKALNVHCPCYEASYCDEF